MEVVYTHYQSDISAGTYQRSIDQRMHWRHNSLQLRHLNLARDPENELYFFRLVTEGANSQLLYLLGETVLHAND